MDLVRKAVREEMKSAAVRPVPMFMTKAAAARAFGVGITKFSQLVAKGIIPTVEIDGAEMISRTSMERLDVPREKKRLGRPPKPKPAAKSDGKAQAASFRAKLKKL